MQLSACISRACCLRQPAPRAQATLPRAAAAAPPPRAAAWQRPPCNRRLATRASSSESDAAGSSAAGEEPMLVPRRATRKRPKRLGSELPGELASLAALCSITKPGDLAALAAAVAALGPTREDGVVQHGTAVAAHLQQLGLTQAQMAALLLRSPQLFSWPAEERAAPLFVQLMGRLSLTAEQAAECFRQQPTAAHCTSFESAIEALAELFAAAAGGRVGGTAGGSIAEAALDETAGGEPAADCSSADGPSADSSSGAWAALSEAERHKGEQQLGQLLESAPAAVALQMRRAHLLRQRCADLQHLYGLSAKQLVAALKANPLLLTRDPRGHLAAVAKALEQELEVDGRALVGAMLAANPRTVGCGVEALRLRAQALLTVFTPEQLQKKGRRALGPLAILLAVNTPTWQLALAVWRVLGVPDAPQLLLENTAPLTYDWLERGRLANLLAVQRALGLPSMGAVVQQFAAYVAGYAPERLAGRLLFLEHAGRLHLLVANITEWRRERGHPPKYGLPGEPPLVSMGLVATRPDAVRPGSRKPAFAAAVGVSEADYASFIAGLAAHPPYQQLLADAAELRQQLLRDPEVARLAAAGAGASGKRQRQGRQSR